MSIGEHTLGHYRPPYTAIHHAMANATLAAARPTQARKRRRNEDYDESLLAKEEEKERQEFIVAFQSKNNAHCIHSTVCTYCSMYIWYIMYNIYIYIIIIPFTLGYFINWIFSIVHCTAWEKLLFFSFVLHFLQYQICIYKGISTWAIKGGRGGGHYWHRFWTILDITHQWW